MATSNLKTKYLLLLPEPFNLDIPYADRQRVVIVADAQVEAERRARARSADPGAPGLSPLLGEEDRPADLGPADLGPADLGPAGDGSPAAALGRQLVRGLREINRDLGNDLRRDFRDVRNASTDFKRKLDDRTARRALRRNSAR